MSEDGEPLGPRPAMVYHKCPECGDPMGFAVDTDGTQTSLTCGGSIPPPVTWECPSCGLQEAAGADVEAKIQGRPRLL